MIVRSLLAAAAGYLNFGTTTGVNGYGLRDNAGSVEVKSSGGAWTGLSAPGQLLAVTTTGTAVASLADTTTITSAGDDYEISLVNCRATASDYLVLQVYAKGAWQTAGYAAAEQWAASGGNSPYASASGSAIWLTYPSARANGGGPISGVLRLTAANDTAQAKMITGVVSQVESNGYVTPLILAGCWNGDTTAPIRGVRVIAGGGSTITGAIRVTPLR